MFAASLAGKSLLKVKAYARSRILARRGWFPSNLGLRASLPRGNVHALDAAQSPGSVDHKWPALLGGPLEDTARGGFWEGLKAMEI